MAGCGVRVIGGLCEGVADLRRQVGCNQFGFSREKEKNECRSGWLVEAEGRGRESPRRQGRRVRAKESWIESVERRGKGEEQKGS